LPRAGILLLLRNSQTKAKAMNTKTRLLTAFKIWLVIYPSITLYLATLGDLLSTLPLYQRTFILTATLVPWMMFVGIPIVDSLIKRFIKTTPAK
jgi:antibiotic biosynthesis monooxygenase (ABM) superfamily enzyme